MVLERLAVMKRDFPRILLSGDAFGTMAAALGGRGAVTPLSADAQGVLMGAPDQPADLAISFLSLHQADDPVGELVQLRRMLRPDGLVLAVMMGGETLAELRAALAEAEIAVTGGLSPRVLPMAALRDAGGLLQRAGLALPVADSDRILVWYPDLAALVRDLRGMGGSNALAARHRGPLRRAIWAQAALHYAQHFSRADGKLRATAELITLTGWVPHHSQQQPLRPGSAMQRLADALGSCEIPINDKSGG